MNKSFKHALRQVFRTLPFIALFFAMIASEARAADATVAIEKVRAFRDGDVFTAEISTTTAWNGTDVQVKYMNDFIQAEVAGTFLNNGKELVRVDDRIFKSVYATQKDSNTMRIRFFVKQGESAKTLVGKLHAKRAGSSITFEIAGDLGDAALAKSTNDNAQTLAVVDESGANDTLNAKLVSGGAVTASTTSGATAKAEDMNAAALAKANEIAAEETAKVGLASAKSADAPVAAASEKKIDTNKLPESQIPVLAATKDTKKSEGSPIFKMIMTLGILAIALGAGAYGAKRMASRKATTKGSSTKIKVLTSHHLGPKKNLTIIQVAGETLLIGVTDNNITMLKTLSLLDDEIPESVPQRFNQSMDDFADLDDEEPIAMRGLDQIRDTVSARLKNMRNI